MVENNQSFHQELTQKYYDLIEKLNKEGTERSRNRIMEIDLEQKRLEKEIKDFSKWKDSHEADNDYNFKNFKFGNKLLAEELPKQAKKIDLAITYSQDASRCTAEANKAAQSAIVILEEARIDNKKFIRNMLIGIIMLFLTSMIPQIMKLSQDHGNQREMIGHLEELGSKLEKFGK